MRRSTNLTISEQRWALALVSVAYFWMAMIFAASASGKALGWAAFVSSLERGGFSHHRMLAWVVIALEALVVIGLGER